jgi:hypothetical protein
LHGHIHASYVADVLVSIVLDRAVTILSGDNHTFGRWTYTFKPMHSQEFIELCSIALGNIFSELNVWHLLHLL